MSSDESGPALQVQNLRFSRKQSEGEVFQLDVPVMKVERGQVVALVGPSGSGKSTLLNLVSALEEPDSGEIAINFGSGLTPVSQGFDHALIGRIFQAGHLLSSATVAANVALGLASSEDALDSVDRTKLAKAIAQLGLPESALDRPVWQLSGGQQQRVAIARALISDPAIIIADEPTSSLDPDLARDLMIRLRQWVDDAPEDGPRTILWVTHDYSLVAAAADSLFVVRTERQDNLVRSYLSEPSGSPESVPATVAEIEALVGVAGRIDGQSTEILDSQTSGWRGIGRSVAFSQMLRGGGRRAGRGLARTLSLPRHSLRRGPSPMHFLAAFSEWSFFARIFIAIVVFQGLLVLWAIQDHQTNSVLESPGNCHTIISGTSADLNLTPGELQALAEAPWRAENAVRNVATREDVTLDAINAQMSAVPTDQGCDTVFAAWPRRDIGVAVWTPIGELNCPDSAVDESGNRRRTRLQAAVMHRGEPALEALTAWDGASVSQAFRVRDNPSEYLAAIFSSYTAERVLGLSPQALDEIGFVCIRGPGLNDGDPLKVPVVAVADGLPRDNSFYFDMVLPLEAFELNVPSQKDQSYRRVALYFKSDELGFVSDYLDRTGNEGGGVRYRYDPDSIERFRVAVDVNLVIVSAIFVVSVLIVIGNLLMIVASLSTIIQANRRPIAMQIAMGVQSRILWGTIRWFISIIFIMALVAAAVVSLLIWVLALWYGAAGNAIADNLIAIGAGVFVRAFVVSVIVSALTCAIAFTYSTWATRRDMRGRLAQILQSGA